MISFNNKEKIDDLINDSEVLLLQFGAQTCVPCVSIKEKIDIWQKDYPNVISRYISIEDFPEIAAEHGVFSAPTILVFVEGKIAIKVGGYFGLDDVFEKVERYISLLELQL